MNTYKDLHSLYICSNENMYIIFEPETAQIKQWIFKIEYKQIIKNTLVSVQETLLALKDIEVSLSFDHQRSEYILITDVWEDGKRFYYPLIHISLKNNQEVWLKCDNTDLLTTTEKLSSL